MSTVFPRQVNDLNGIIRNAKEWCSFVSSSTNCLVACIFLSILSSHSFATTTPLTFTVKNPFYESLMHCEWKVPLVVKYELSHDHGNAKRYPRYINDESLLAAARHCHPTTWMAPNTYQAVLSAQGRSQRYDVGHLAASNHLDSDEGSRIANQFSNLAPQASGFNRLGGAWYETELITECQRDAEDLTVWVGTIDDRKYNSRDYFVETFGQVTPEYWWRVILYKSSNKYSAWLMPNDDSSSRQRLLAGEFDSTLQEIMKASPYATKYLAEPLKLQPQKATPDFVRTTTKGRTLICRGISTSTS